MESKLRPKLRWVIAEVTVKVAMPVPCGTPRLDKELTNSSLEHYHNVESDPVLEILPHVERQLEEDISSDNPFAHLKFKILRDARKADIKGFSIEDLTQKIERRAKYI